MPATNLYEVKPGDTLYGIAKRFYQDGAFYTALARYNSIFNPHALKAGRKIVIPSISELSAVQDIKPPITPPAGLTAIKKTFGDLFRYINADGSLKPAFENKYMTRIPIPLAIPYAADKQIKITALYGHRELKDIFQSVFRTIKLQGLSDAITSYGRCFCFRYKRGSSELSVHSWGIAVDLNPESNTMGTKGNIPREMVKIFKEHGFTWGGDWSGRNKDPMHFQYCEGY